MALCFALGSSCFLLGPLPGFVGLVGPRADAAIFFAGSILFTAGGALQTWLAGPGRPAAGAARTLWWAAVIQSAGTLFFNATTYRALHTTIGDPHYDRVVWRPDALGSICFLVSGFLAYRASARHGARPARDGPGWWEPIVNLLGCVAFGIAAIASYAVPSSASVLDAARANVTTSLGALCFLACALATLRTGRTSKARRHRPLAHLEHAMAHDVRRVL
jgi:hypothetical protein